MLPQSRLADEVLKQLDAVERDDRDALEVRGVQGVVGLDVDLVKRLPDRFEDRARVIAQVAAGTPVEHEPRRAHASARSPDA